MSGSLEEAALPPVPPVCPVVEQQVRAGGPYGQEERSADQQVPGVRIRSACPMPLSLTGTDRRSAPLPTVPATSPPPWFGSRWAQFGTSEFGTGEVDPVLGWLLPYTRAPVTTTEGRRVLALSAHPPV